MQLANHLRVLPIIVLLAATAPLPLVAQQIPPAEGNEATLIAVLESDAALFEKAKACQQLAVIGTKQAVPALAELLADEQLSHYARFGLEPISDPAVDEALRDALGRLAGRQLVGVINSVGVRRDAQAVSQLNTLLTGPDAELAAAAAGALGRIATPEATKALAAALDGPEPVRTAAADAYLTAADTLAAGGKTAAAIQLYDDLIQAKVQPHLTIAALHGLIRVRGTDGLPLLAEQLRCEERTRFQVGLRMAQEMASEQVTQVLLDSLGQLPPARQALVIHVLGDRGDSDALPRVLELATAGDLEVRRAAVEVLASLGDGSVVPVLLDAAVAEDADLAQSARASLADLPGADVDAALARRLAGSDGAGRVVLVELVGLRGIESAVPGLLTLAAGPDEPLRAAAIGALGRTIGLDDLSRLVGILVNPQSPDDGPAAKSALSKACLRMPDRDATANILLDQLAQAPATAKSDLLDLLGELGGAKALQGVSAAARSDDEAMQDAATRVLGGWMSPDAAPVLLDLAKQGNSKFQVRTLRGYLRVARQLDVPLPERIAMCREALAIAQRPDEKKLAFEVLARFPSAESLAIVQPYLDDAGLKQAAAASAVTIAEAIVASDPAAVAAAMEKAAEVAEDAETAGKARRLLRRAKK